MLSRCFTLIAVLATAHVASAQWQFSKLVRDKALLPRNVTSNLGEAAIAGAINNTGYTRLQYKVWQNGKLYTSYFQSLSYSGGIANFDLRIKLKAGKFRYKILLEALGKDTISRVFDDIVVGDVYIIQGQSNAVANSYVGLSQTKYGDSFIRSFGNSTYDPAVSVSDTLWYLARGDGLYNRGCIGQWGLVMARALLDTFGIPIALINGAVGGTSVVYHQRYIPEPDNIYTCYGRLLTRMKKGGLDKNVRGIFWFQGESDGTQPKLHDSVFKVLYSDWLKDYKGIQQNYMVQVRGGGCGNPTLEMLEVQRQFGYNLNKLKVVSSNGLNGHDGCHYGLVDGYEQLGLQFAALVSRDLYDGKKKTHIDPPQILRAEYNNAALSEIILTMENTDDNIFSDPGFHALFSVTGDNTVFITGGKILNNRVLLQLNKGTCVPLYLSYMGKSGSQPWVKNSLRMGLVGFYKLRITKKEIRTTYSGCRNSKLILGEDSIAGCKYLWTNKKNGFSATTAKIKWTLTGDENFQLVLVYPTSGCFRDTYQVAVVMDKTAAPELGPDTILCNHSVLNITLPTAYAKTTWRQGLQVTQKADFSTSVSGLVRLEAYSSLGCVFSDSVMVRTSAPTVHITTPEFVCAGKDTVSFATEDFSSYTWNGNTGNSKLYRHKAGEVILVAEDSLGCKARDTSVLSEYAVVQLPDWKYEVCPYDSVLLSKPSVVNYWEVNGSEMPGNVFVHAGSSGIYWLDNNLCTYRDTLLIKPKELPVFTLGKDTAICQGSEVVFRCSYTTAVYRWNGAQYPVSVYKTKNPGTVSCMVIGINGCEYSDSANISFHPTPSFYLPKDTEICENKIWLPELPAAYSYTLNGVPTGKVQIKFTGNYSVTAFNGFGCSKENTVHVKFVVCTNRAPGLQTEDIILYPNPTAGELYIPDLVVGIYAIQDNQGRVVLAGTRTEGFAIDVSMLHTGSYTIRFQDRVARFVKL